MLIFRKSRIGAVKSLLARCFFTRSECKSSLQTAFTIRKLTVEDQEDVLKLASRFWPNEPLNKAAGLMADGVMTEEIARPIVRALPQQLSYGAFDRSGDIVGVAVCNLLRRNENQFDISESEDPASRRLNLVLTELEKRANFWSHVSCDAVAYNTLSIINDHWRGQGVIGQMILTVVREGKKVGLPGLRTDCSSFSAQRVMEKLDSRKIYSLKYADIPSAPTPPEPHTHVVMYYLE